MIKVKKEGVVLRKRSFEFEEDGVLNPAAIRVGDTVRLFYRAVRKGNYSTIGEAVFNTPLSEGSRKDAPVMVTTMTVESHGLEDPRIVRIDDLYYLSYTAYDGVNALGALALSTDLIHFEKIGVIAPRITYTDFIRLAQSHGKINEKYLRYNKSFGDGEVDGKTRFIWDKNLIFFPRRIGGQLCFLHRIRPDIQLASVDTIEGLTTEFWEDHFSHLDEQIVLSPKYDFEVSYIGGGCPPIETEAGWLLIYHGVHDTINGYVYVACAALLDLEDPRKELSRLPYPLFSPEHDWELRGEVNNVCFPTGAVVFGERLYIYYGAADERIACASVHLFDLVSELKSHILQHENE